MHMASRASFFALNCALLVALGSPAVARSGTTVQAAGRPLQTLHGQTPDAVISGTARPIGRHAAGDVLTLNLGLAVRDAAGLDARIAAATTPGSTAYGTYLTNDAYLARYAPTQAQAAAVRAWATSQGLSIVATSPDRLLVTVRGTTAAVEHAFATTIDDYTLHGQAVRSNSGDPVVPADLGLSAISGFSTLHRFHSYLSRRSRATRTLAGPARPAMGRTGASRSTGYFPQDFRTAYDAGAVGDGGNQTIGLTLWGAPLQQSDLTAFASNTGTTAVTVGGSGADGVEFVAVNGGSTDTSAWNETALDVETAHGMAPGSHLRYWLADCAIDPATNACIPSDTGLEQAISAAANDTSLHVVSNSWGGGEPTSTNDPFTTNVDASFQHAVSIGTTFYFSTGDQGSYSGTNPGSAAPAPSFPADSPYVVAVGGTNLQTDATTFAYMSETAWSCADYAGCTSSSKSGGTGGGCSTVFARPAWQTGVTAATCTGRATPDISAAGDPATGAYVYVNGAAVVIGGTSLAAPLWAGMAADLNRYLGAKSQALMGFSGPRIYQLATNATTYARDFHDVTSGQNGPVPYTAGTGWDEVTGWGSVDLAHLAADWTSAASGVPTATSIAQASSTATATATRTATGTSTATRTATPTATSIATRTATPTATAAATATGTSTATPTDTATATGTPSMTPVAMAANTSTATATATATATNTAIATLIVPAATIVPSATVAASATVVPPSPSTVVGAASRTALPAPPTGLPDPATGHPEATATPSLPTSPARTFGRPTSTRPSGLAPVYPAVSYLVGGVAAASEFVIDLTSHGKVGVHVLLTVVFADGSTVRRRVEVRAAHTVTVPLAVLSTRREPFGVLVASDHPLSSHLGMARKGHSVSRSTGSVHAARAWYFAATPLGRGVHETIAMLNPDPTRSARVTLRFIAAHGTQHSRTAAVSVAAHRILVVDADRLVRGAGRMSATIRATVPIVVERVLVSR